MPRSTYLTVVTSCSRASSTPSLVTFAAFSVAPSARYVEKEPTHGVRFTRRSQRPPPPDVPRRWLDGRTQLTTPPRPIGGGGRETQVITIPGGPDDRCTDEAAGRRDPW